MTSFFPQIETECKPEWNREAIMVFYRLPSLRRLQATPPLQTSLAGTPCILQVVKMCSIKMNLPLSNFRWLSVYINAVR